ncbi:MAG: PilZ domain-containing protein [Gammaproteobacteria bacterium]|nr:PilZ domain-containing protein [Gammaproteobacteria bacterium]
MNEYSEKRDFKRLAIDYEFSFCEAGDKQMYDGHVINLSSKGILFTSGESFEVGTPLDIVLRPSNSLTPPMEASALVSRVLGSDSSYEIACEITEIK